MSSLAGYLGVGLCVFSSAFLMATHRPSKGDVAFFVLAWPFVVIAGVMRMFPHAR